MVIDCEQLSNELKKLPGGSVLALDDLHGGRIPIEDIRLKRLVKAERPGMSTETLLLVLSDKPQIGASRLLTVEQLRKVLKKVPCDAHVVFENQGGEMIPVESVRPEHPVQFEKPGMHTKIALVVLLENPWN